MRQASFIAILFALLLPGCGRDPFAGLIGQYFPIERKHPGAEIASLEPGVPFLVRTDPAPSFSEKSGELNGSKIAERYLVRWDGFLNIPADGKFYFELKVNDGGALFLGENADSPLIDLWNSEAENPKRAKAEIELAAGKVPVTIWYFNNRTKAEVEVHWSRDGEDYREIKPHNWSHAPEQADVAWNAKFWEEFEGLLPIKLDWKLPRAELPEAPPEGTDAKVHNHRRNYDAKAMGPFLFGPVRIGSLEKPQTIVRGLTIFFDDEAQTGAVYDLDEMRLAAVWDDRSFVLSAVPHTFNHTPIPRCNGDLLLRTEPGEGWQNVESLKFLGVRLVEGRIQLEYEVNGVKILERPSYQLVFNSQGFYREFILPPLDQKLVYGSDLVINPNPSEHRFWTGKHRAGKPIDPASIPPNPRFIPSPSLPITTKGTLGKGAVSEEFPYTIDRITVPTENPLGAPFFPAGFDFFEGGSKAAVSTWHGDVWIVDGLTENLESVTWTRIATGINEPMGLKIVNGEIYTSGADQLTKLVDEDGDGAADFYQCLSNRWEVTESFHCFGMDLQADEAGNFYFTLTAPVDNGWGFTEIAAHQGSILKVSPDGEKVEMLASGLRAPNGLGFGPDGVLIVTDNEGTLVPASPIHWIDQPNQFCGVVDTYHGEGIKSSRYDAPKEERVLIQDERPEPLLWFPKSVDSSPATPLWLPPDDRFGPLAGSMVCLSYGQCAIFSVLADGIGEGKVQGAAVKWPIRPTSSGMRARFNNGDGTLYVAGMKGWQTNAVRDAGFDRIRYMGGEAFWPAKMRVLEKGIELTFTTELEPELAEDPESYAVQAGDTRWQYGYGSPVLRLGQRGTNAWGTGWTPMTVESAKLLADKKTVRISVPDMQLAHLLQVDFDVESADGALLTNTLYGTVHFMHEK